jgi:hypothetical protein
MGIPIKKEELEYKCSKCNHVFKSEEIPTICPNCGFKSATTPEDILGAFVLVEALDLLEEKTAEDVPENWSSETVAPHEGGLPEGGGEFGGAGASDSFESESDSGSGTSDNLSGDDSGSDTVSND